MDRRAKIVATIGPTSKDEETLVKMVESGMNVARLNFSYGSYEEHFQTIKLLRDITNRLGQPLGILQDLQGPKIRIGELTIDSFTLAPNQTITLTTESDPENPNMLPVDYPDLPENLEPGNCILLSDGNLELEVISVTKKTVETKVIIGGQVKSNSGINLPGIPLSVPGFTEKDQMDLAFGLENGVDMIAISFVRSPEDVVRVREEIEKISPENHDIPIIAKIERPEALDHLHEIVGAAEGVMVARGDLGVEMPAEAVPIAQKQIIDTANHQGKLVITATQMLNSMITSPRPTRAEASDVANAIFDGSDAVMLSGETANGKYPIEAISMMDAIITEAEDHSQNWGHWRGTTSTASGDSALSITRAARELAHDLNVSAIVVFTQTGRTAALMSKAFPRVPILGFTPESRTYRRMSLYWGVYPYLVPYSDSLGKMLEHVDDAIVAMTALIPGNQVVVITGYPVGEKRSPNLALMYTVGQSSIKLS